MKKSLLLFRAVWLALPISLLAFGVRLASAQSLPWKNGPGHRAAPLAVPASGRTGFTLLTPRQTGIDFTNQLSFARAEANQNLMNGAGVAAGDFDGDGLCDLFFSNTEGPSGLFRNLGNGRFANVTDAAGVGCTNQASKGACFADIDGDGRLDLIVVGLGGPNACFLNLGGGRFTNVTASAGLVSRAGAHSVALADIDGDGNLDLYAANYGENSILRSGGKISVRKVNGKDVVAGRHASRLKIIDGRLIEFGEADALYRNDGKGRFTPVSWTDGTFRAEDGKPLKIGPPDMGLSVMFRDLNGDGAPDLYVCNDFQTPDRIWLNDGAGRFRALPDLALRHTPHFSMGVDFADIDRDGLDDFFVGDMLSRVHKLRMTQMGETNPPTSHVGEDWDRQQVRRNVLALNRGDGTYTDIACFAGVEASEWSWSVAFLDVDFDGYEDLLIATAHAYDTQDLDMQEKMPTGVGLVPAGQPPKSLKNFPPLITPNILFRNRGDRTFEEVGARWGFDSTNISHGIALCDLDNDGDLDVVVSCLWAAPLIYRNESAAPRVAVRLKGRAPNTRGIGAKIKVLGGAVPVQSQEMICGGRYLSGDEPVRAFAAGSLTNKLSIEVTWRNGARSLIADAPPNHLYEVEEPAEVRGQRSEVRGQTTQHATRSTPPLFKDVSDLITFTHQDPAFDDFARQPLLHKLLSRLGPGVAWCDLFGDGHDQLVIASGRGGAPGVFRKDGAGRFTRDPLPAWSAPAPDDLTTPVLWTSAAGQDALLIGQANYESAPDVPSLVSRYDIASRDRAAPAAKSSLLSSHSIGALAVADVDGDGVLDVFVGGRVIGGRYPEAASSQLFKGSGESLVPDDVNSALLKKIGLVSSAVFSDLNGDGLPELILACEWGPIRVFQNDKGKLREVTAELGFDKFPGWWNGVTTGDLDGDGRLDIIASNWGLNSSYRVPEETPFRLYYGDFDGNGTVDLLEGYTDAPSGRIVQRRDLVMLGGAMPLLRARFPTHAAFSLADVPAILGAEFPKAQQVQAGTLASMLFLNRGDHFDAVPLPSEAQYAPAFGVNVADFDGDGNEDVFLAQNFFATRLEEPRLDAGRGLLLRGDGRGGLAPVAGQDSGVKIHGEQRGSAAGDYDEDGRVDLVVAQNSGPVKLFHNETAKPGLRVRLAGPRGNLRGVGATMRLVFDGKPGPAREIHAGSGYWSQDSAVQVLATPSAPSALIVRWPGGGATTTAIPPGAKEIAASLDGQTRLLK